MASSAKSVYFVHPIVDFLCAGALSMAALAVFYATTGSHLNQTAALWSVYLSWVINWPHFSATSHRLFRKKSNWREFPMTAFLVPVVVAAGVFASFAQPDTVAPYFLKAFLLWSPYHFSGQTVGVTLLYTRRAGFEWANWERRALAFFVFATFLAPTLTGETAVSEIGQYYEMPLPSFHIPAFVASAAWALLYASSAVLAFAVVRRFIVGKKRFPAIAFMPPLAQLGWFVLGWRVPSFYYHVPFFHSLQYLLIAWAMHLSERQAEAGVATAGFRARQTLAWVGLNLAGGAALFWGLPQLAHARGIALPMATGVLIAAVQIHHFVVDGVIWKLRNPKVAAALVGAAAPAPRRKAA